MTDPLLCFPTELDDPAIRDSDTDQLTYQERMEHGLCKGASVAERDTRTTPPWPPSALKHGGAKARWGGGGGVI